MTSPHMDIVVAPDGTARCIYAELIDLSALGESTITRVSYVEPEQHGRWRADLSPVGGPVLGPFRQRSEALAAEAIWLGDYLLKPLPATHNH